MDGLSSVLPLVLDVLVRGLVAGSPDAPEDVLPSSSPYSEIFLETSSSPPPLHFLRNAANSSVQQDLLTTATSASVETDEIFTDEEFLSLSSSPDYPPLPASFACGEPGPRTSREEEEEKAGRGAEEEEEEALCGRYLDSSAFDRVKAERLGELRQGRRDGGHSGVPSCLLELATDTLLRERKERHWRSEGGSRRERLIDLVEHARLHDVENVGAMLKENLFIQALVMVSFRLQRGEWERGKREEVMTLMAVDFLPCTHGDRCIFSKWAVHIVYIHWVLSRKSGSVRWQPGDGVLMVTKKEFPDRQTEPSFPEGTSLTDG